MFWVTFFNMLYTRISDIRIERLEANIQPDSVRFVLARFNDRLVVQIFSTKAYQIVCDDVFYQNGDQLGAWHIDNWDIQWWHTDFRLWDHDHHEPLDDALRSLLPQIRQAIEEALATK
jgi:hypothetical protein